MGKIRTIAGALTSPAVLIAWFWEFVRAQLEEAAVHNAPHVWAGLAVHQWAGIILFAGTVWLWWPHIKERVPLLTPRYVSLPEAAQRLYQKNIDTPYGQFCRNLANAQENLLNFCGIFIKARVPLYGKRSLGPLQKVPQDELENLFLVSGASALSKNAIGDRVIFSDLCVRRSEFGKLLKSFKGDLDRII